jgi:hypothetical protein
VSIHGLTGNSPVEMPTTRLRFSNCAFQGVAAAIDHQAAGALVVEIDNSLHLGHGPVVRLNRAPRPDEPLQLGLQRFTVRGGGPIVECLYGELAKEPGRLAIQAVDCAFWPGEGEPLLRFTGVAPPDSLLRGLAWSGSGSVVAPLAPLAVWRQPGGAQVAASEAAMEVGGLVRSEVTFAGDVEAGPAGSRIVRWQVPLNSNEPPGIDPRMLPTLNSAPGALAPRASYLGQRLSDQATSPPPAGR